MSLRPWDWVIVLGYFVLSGIIGLSFARRAGKSVTEFFVSGRSVPWWLAGTSMVATTFSADTPLAVAGMVARNGVAGNWLWWNMVLGGTLTVFFYARLWRRAEVLTDVEFTEIRYSGRPASVLRALRALYLALPINLFIIGWVNLAMLTILEVTLGIAPLPALAAMFLLTVLYSTLSGLWGVLVTDVLQFVIAMTGCIVLAVFAVREVGGVGALLARLPEHYGSADRALAIIPTGAEAMMPVTAFLAYLTVQWWATYYPGSEPGGGGYVAQRIFSARTERDGVLATLWFNIAHFAIRPWPWVLTALAVVVLYPGVSPARGFVQAAVDLLPTGLRGLMVAAFAAAYMSTLATQLNWGASYLVNDVYLRFVNPRADQRRLVRFSRLATALTFLLSAVVTYGLSRLGSVEGAWQLLLALGAGTGLVLILRWFWWRINAWSEMTSMVVPLVGLVGFWGFGVFDPFDTADAAYLMVANTVITTAAWLVATYVTAPTADQTLVSFYRRVRPGGPGWRRIAERAGLAAEPVAGGVLSWVNWIASAVSIYATLFGVGRLLFGRTAEGLVYLAVAALAFGLVARNLEREWGAGAPPRPSGVGAPETAAAD